MCVGSFALGNGLVQINEDCVMCGIYGYVGEPAPVVSLVATALRDMEYRGYDSWGIGWDDGCGLDSRKDVGRVPALDDDAAFLSTIALGHTRWATHGGVTQVNAHPHIDASRQIGVVHNGVVENVAELRSSLPSSSAMVSETDTEVIVHLIERELAAGREFLHAIERVFRMLTGNNAIVVAHRPTGQIAAITSRTPLRIGRRNGSYHIASDPVALAATSDQIAIVPDNVLVVLATSGVTLTQIATGSLLEPDWIPAPKSVSVSRGIFDHFTLKEVHDQPGIIRDLDALRVEVEPLVEAIRRHRHVVLTGCGSAYYAASLGAEWVRAAWAEAWIDVIPASEISASTRNLGSDTIVVALTQSGETADVVDAVHTARIWGAATATLVNTVSSTVAGMVDIVLPIHAGVERSVLATKSFMAMVVRLAQIAHALSGQEDFDIGVVETLPIMEHWLDSPLLRSLGNRLAAKDHVLVLGKEIGHKIALEAALKIKEGSYVHAEGFLTGELKHGPLALVSDGTPALLFASNERELEGAKIAAHEIRSRGGYTIGIGAFPDDSCSTVLHVPLTGTSSAMVQVVIAQVLAYHIAVARGVDPDYPRNLAKSVTVR